MFISNEAFKVSVDQGQGGIIKTIDNVQTYITDVPEVGVHQFKAIQAYLLQLFVGMLSYAEMQGLLTFISAVFAYCLNRRLQY